MKKLFLITTLLLFVTNIFCQSLKSGMIYGKNHAFMLTAPDGWVLDNQAGVSQGLHAVFYKEGESWSEGESVMYATSGIFEETGYKNIDDLIEKDGKDFIRNYADIKIVVKDDIKINDSTKAKVRYLSGKSYGNFEAMAYIDAGSSWSMIILTCRTQEGFNSSTDAFNTLVKSYYFLSNKIEIEDKKN
ncbi:hypothetical protein ACQ33O_09335 [Ferruginibacter sp. SUN002]|uniref:hypothetical protein n=1 Tax=Ferruginibacter sp. SUN002 TaxID=2937789 RepID=UPI003D36FD31